MDPSFAMAHFNIGNVHEVRGRLDEAIASYRRAVELSGGMPFTLSFLAAALARVGKPDEARRLLDKLLERANEGTPLSLWLAIVYEALGEKAAALDHIDRALEQREPLVVDVNTTFLPFTSLRAEPRYQKIVQQVSEHWGWSS